MSTYVAAILCVVGLAIGQILFKTSAMALSDGLSLFSIRAAAPLIAAMFLYATTSLVWVWILQNIELGKVYPLMALAFILVPLGSNFFFGEKFTPQYILGISLITLGIVISTNS